MVSKLDLTIIAAFLLGGAYLIERGHRVVIEAPAPAELAARAAAAACPDNDNVPYSAACIAFLEGRTMSGMYWRANTGEISQRR